MNLSDRFALLSPVVNGRVADAFVKQRAERTNALKSDLKANVSHGQAANAQQFFGLIDTALDQVLAGRRIERIAKQPQEMISGKTGLPGNLVEVKRLIVTLIDEPARAPQTCAKIVVGML